MKAVESNDDDDYTNSAWANGNALKNNFSGVGNVSITGLGGRRGFN